MPGIYELARRRSAPASLSRPREPEYGPRDIRQGGQGADWCAVTVYRWNAMASVRAEFPVRTYSAKSLPPRRRRTERPLGPRPDSDAHEMHRGRRLREAFPDEIGGEHTAEEMDGQRALDATVIDTPPPPKPEGYDDWLTALLVSCDTGTAASAWACSPEEHRLYLAETDALTFEQVKAKASEKE